MNQNRYFLFKNRKFKAAAVFAVLFFLTQYLAYQRFQINNENEEDELIREIHRIENNLTLLLGSSESATRALAFVVEKNRTAGTFDSLAKVIISSNRYLDAVQLTKNGVISQVYPLQGNESTLGFDVLNDSSVKREALKALTAKKLFFAGPLQLRQGGLGLVGRLPIFTEDEFYGFAAVIIKFSTFLTAAGIDTSANSVFQYQVSKLDPNTGTETFFLRQSFPRSNDAWNAGTYIDLPAGDWRIYVRAKEHGSHYAEVIWLCIAGVAISLASGFVTYYMLNQPEKLQALVLEQTKRIESSEKYFRALIDNIADGIILLDANGKTLYQSPSSWRITGYSLDELQHQNGLGLLHPDDINESSKVFERVAGKPGSIEVVTHRLLHKKGNYIWIEGTFTNLLHEEAISGIVFTYHDITQQKQAEEEIITAYKEKDVVLQRISDSVISVDNQWRYTFLNDAALAEHPSGREATIGKVIWDIHPGMKGTIFWNTYHEAMETQNAIELEGYYAPMGRWFDLKAYPSREGLTVFYGDITERKNTEAILAQNEKRFRALIENSTDGLTVLNADGMVVEISPSGRKILGYDERELVGKQRPDLIHPSDREKVMNAFMEIVADPTNIKTVEYRHKMPDGSDKWLECTFHNLLNEPNLNGIVLNYKDITDRKKNEEHQNLFTSIVNSSEDAIISKTLKGIITSWNHGAEKVFGYTREEIVGKHISIIMPANLQGEETEIISKISRGEGIRQYQTVRITKAGQPKNVSLTISAIKDSTGIIIGASVILRDITDTIRITQELQKNTLELKRSNNELVEAQAVAKVGSWETDLNTLELTWSLETYHIFELDPNHFKPAYTSFLKFVHPADRAEVDAAFVASFNNTDINTIEHRIVTGIGTEKWVLERWRVFNDELGKPFRAVGTCQDITDRKVAEIEKALLINNTEESFVLLDNHLIIVSFNYQFFKLYKKYFGQIIEKGRSILEYTPSERRDIINATYSNVLQGKTEESELSFPDPEGSTKIFSIKYKPAKNDSGEVIGVFVTCSDVTERKKAEEQIYIEKYFSDSVINSLPGIFYLYDREGRFARWNKNFETISGYSNEDVSKMHPLDFYNVDEKEIARKKIENAFAGGNEEVVAHFYTKDKKKIPYYFNARKISFDGVDYLIGIGIDITEQARAEEELIAYTKEIKKLTAHLQQVREEERTRIAREIHDELGQQLTGLKMDVEWVAKKVSSNSAVSEKITEMISLIDQTVVTIRRIVSELRPGVLDDLGLVAALEWQCKEFEKRTGIRCESDIKLEDLTFGKDLSINLFRIYQEALTNIARHAKATLVTTVLEEVDDHLVLTIKDNGVGFDNGKGTPDNSWGVVGMRERAAIFKGELKIESSLHKGTVVSIRIPLKTITS